MDEEPPRNGGRDGTGLVAHGVDGTGHRCPRRSRSVGIRRDRWGPAGRAEARTDTSRTSDVSFRTNGSELQNHQPQSKDPAISPTDRAALIEDLIEGYATLMHRLADMHAPEFLEVQVTMSQAKLLYLLGASGDLHMSDLVPRLGVSLSTISVLVDRVVDQGLVHRREDPVDRRQVVVGLTDAGAAFIDRFRELGADQMRELLALLDDEELESMRRTTIALARAAAATAAAHRPTPASPAVTTLRKDPS